MTRLAHRLCLVESFASPFPVPASVCRCEMAFLPEKLCRQRLSFHPDQHSVSRSRRLNVLFYPRQVSSHYQNCSVAFLLIPSVLRLVKKGLDELQAFRWGRV